MDMAPHFANFSVALANLSQTIDATSGEVQLALWSEDYSVKDSMINVALLTMFCGLFTVLAAVATYVLLSKRLERKRKVLMLAAILVMWISTLAYWTANLVAAVEAYALLRYLTSHISDQMVKMRDCLGSLTTSSASSCQRGEPMGGGASPTAYGIQTCAGTTALTINASLVIIGDSIVWWRAWVLWPDNRVIRLLCVIMIFLTSVTGVLDTVDVCAHMAQEQGWATPGLSSFKLPAGDQFIGGSMFAGSAYGILAGLASLLTNATATALIAYRAWEHRRVIMSYLQAFPPRTQVERTLALLVESGLLYSALWILVLVCDLVHAPPGSEQPAFAHGFRYVMNGCLVPIIGMYPTLMIIMCAVDKSLYEKSVDERARNPFPGFDAPSIRRCETLSVLFSPSSAYTAAEDAGKPSELSKDGVSCKGEA